MSHGPRTAPGPAAPGGDHDDPAVHGAVEAIQKSLAVVARRAKDLAVHEELGARVGFPLSGPYYGTLARIGRAEPCSPSELATLLGAKPSAVSRRLAVLVERGLVDRRSSDRDGRSVELRLTPEGRTVFEALDAGWHQMLREMLRGWDPVDIERFAGLFECFAESLEKVAAASDARPGRSDLDLWPRTPRPGEVPAR